MKKFYKTIYTKRLKEFIFLLNLSRYKKLEILFQMSNWFNIKEGRLHLGVQCDYRLKDVDNKGFTIILNLIFFEIQINFYDIRHVEDY